MDRAASRASCRSLVRPARAARWHRSLIGAVLVYYYVSFSRIIDARLHGERERSLPRVYARPLEVRRGETLTEQDLVARLNDLGYAQRPTVAGARRVRDRASNAVL